MFWVYMLHVKIQMILIEGVYTLYTKMILNLIQCYSSQTLKLARLTSNSNSNGPQILTKPYIYYKLRKYKVLGILEMIHYFCSLNELCAPLIRFKKLHKKYIWAHVVHNHCRGDRCLI